MATQEALLLPPAANDPHARWAIPALERLRQLPPPASGVVGDADNLHTPFRFPDRRMPPPPPDMNDQAAVDRWLRHCSAMRLFGSGN